MLHYMTHQRRIGKVPRYKFNIVVNNFSSDRLRLQAPCISWVTAQDHVWVSERLPTVCLACQLARNFDIDHYDSYPFARDPRSNVCDQQGWLSNQVGFLEVEGEKKRKREKKLGRGFLYWRDFPDWETLST